MMLRGRGTVEGSSDRLLRRYQICRSCHDILSSPKVTTGLLCCTEFKRTAFDRGRRPDDRLAWRTGQPSRSGWYFILISCSMTSPFARTLICHPLTKDILSRQRQEMITDTIDD